MIKGWSMACDSIEDCGGPVRSLLGCVAYFFALEFMIFFDHYYLLHKWDVGKRLGQHAYHHVYKYADQLNAFSGYSFAPQDGWSQGMALPWPFMGCDYHYIHHRYNWYNFGFMTLLFDELFRTVKHPKEEAVQFAIGAKPMPDGEKKRSVELTN